MKCFLHDVIRMMPTQVHVLVLPMYFLINITSKIFFAEAAWKVSSGMSQLPLKDAHLTCFAGEFVLLRQPLTAVDLVALLNQPLSKRDHGLQRGQ